MNKSRQLEAANELEALIPAFKEVIGELRQGQSDEKAYALLYRLRWRIGLITRELGTGVLNAKNQKYADDVIESQM